MTTTPNIATCGTCTLCCKVLAVTELAKPRDTWCAHCVRAGGGCGIYDARPQSCREFECVWLQSQARRHGEEKLPAELRPDRCHVVLDVAQGGEALVAHVDPGYPDAWRSGAIGRFLRSLIERNLSVIVAAGDRRHAFMDRRAVSYRERVQEVTAPPKVAP